MACTAPAQSPATVADLLRALTATGTEVLYSSELVPPGLEAPPLSPGSDPMSRVVAALAAHHLVLRRTGLNRFVVTRASAPSVSVPRTAEPARVDAALEEVPVFASRYAFASGSMGEPVEVDRQSMQEIPGAQSDAVQAARAAPGLATNLSARPYIRGALLDDLMVQFDGIPLIDPFHFKNFQSLLSAFDPAAVGREEVYTGGFPVNFGTRSGGVIDLTPHTVADGHEYSVGASLLSYNLDTVGHAEQAPIDWLLTARHNSDASVLQPINGASGEPTFTDAVGRLRWQIVPTAALTLGGLLLEDRVHLTSDPTEGSATASSTDQHAWLGWEWEPSDSLQSHSALAIDRSERDRSGTLDPAGIANGRLNEERQFSSLELRSQWHYAPSAILGWNFGVELGSEKAQLDFQRQEMFANAVATIFDRNANATITSFSSPSETTLGVFSSARGHWQGLEIEVGLRLDAQDYHGYGARSQLSPRVNLRYDVTPLWHLYGSWGEFTQAQRVDEYRSEENQLTPDSATRARHLIAGIEQESLGTRWRVEAYRNDWTSISPYFDNTLNPLSLLPELEPDRILVTTTDAESTGIEFSAQRQFAAHFHTWGTYTLASATDEVLRQAIPRSWDQRQAASLGVAWSQARTSASLMLGWHSGWPRTPVSVFPGTALLPAELMVGSRNSARWGDYFNAALRASQTFPLRYGDLSLWIDATNITNRGNDCCVELSSTANDKAWSPRAVNVGFTWRVHHP